MILIGKPINCSVKMKKQFQNIDVQDIKVKFALKIDGTNTKALSEIKKALFRSSQKEIALHMVDYTHKYFMLTVELNFCKYSLLKISKSFAGIPACFIKFSIGI